MEKGTEVNAQPPCVRTILLNSVQDSTSPMSISSPSRRYWHCPHMQVPLAADGLLSQLHRNLYCSRSRPLSYMPGKTLGESKTPHFADNVEHQFLTFLKETGWRSHFIDWGGRFCKIFMRQASGIMIDITWNAHCEQCILLEDPSHLWVFSKSSTLLDNRAKGPQ